MHSIYSLEKHKKIKIIHSLILGIIAKLFIGFLFYRLTYINYMLSLKINCINNGIFNIYMEDLTFLFLIL